ncbi:hypothetical protein ACOMHN_052604 [Nucella lapillus]
MEIIWKLNLVLCCAVLTDLSRAYRQGNFNTVKARVTPSTLDVYINTTNIATLTPNNVSVPETTTLNNNESGTENTTLNNNETSNERMATDYQTSATSHHVFNLNNLPATTNYQISSSTNHILSVSTTTDEKAYNSSLGDEVLPENDDSGERYPPRPTVSEADFASIMGVVDVVTIVVEMVSLALTAASAWVYALRNMRCTTAVYLAAMNVLDTLGGALVTCIRLWRYVEGSRAVSTLAYSYVSMAGAHYLALSCRRSVYCLSVIVSMERFFVISFPLKARYFKIIQFPKLTVLILTTIVFTFHIYLPLKYQVLPLASTRGGYRVGYTASYRENVQIYEAVSNSAKFIFAYIPLCFGLAMSLALLVALRRHAVTRASLQEKVVVVMVNKREEAEKEGQVKKKVNRRSAERQLARTILLSTLLFILLSLPSNTAHLVSTYHDTFGFLKLDDRLYRLTSRFSYLALVLSRYTNFLSYVCLSTAFRQNLRRILLCKMATTVSSKFSKSSRNQTTDAEDQGTSMSVISSMYQREGVMSSNCKQKINQRRNLDRIGE